MNPRARVSRAAQAMLLAAAVCAAVPPVRWCPVRWDEIAAELFLRCAVAASVGSPACAMSFNGGTPPSPPPASCRLLGSACGSDCAAAPSRAERDAGREPCPLVAGATATADPEERPASGRPGRVFWLGDAAYASALRSPEPELGGPGVAAALPPAVAGPERPAGRTEQPPVAALAAPPSRLSNPPPPARAPPSEA